MRVLLIFMFLPFSSIGQDWTTNVISGLNYNFLSQSHYLTTTQFGDAENVSFPKKVFAESGIQVGAERNLQFENGFFLGGACFLEIRSLFLENAYSVRNDSGRWLGNVHLGIRMIDLNPGIIAGYNIFKNLRIGTGISFPITVISFSRVIPDKDLKASSINLKSMNGRFLSMSTNNVNIPFFFRFQINENLFFHAGYIKGLFNRFQGYHTVKDNLIVVSLGVRIS